jgi:hypothetical protein
MYSELAVNNSSLGFSEVMPMKFIIIAIFSVAPLFLFGCSSLGGSGTSTKPVVELSAQEAAIRVAKQMIDQGSYVKGISHAMLDVIDREEGQWQVKIAKQLKGKNLEAGKAQCAQYKQRVQKVIVDISEYEKVIKKVSEKLRTQFTDDELIRLVDILAAPEWQKFGQVKRQISLSPDYLGLVGEFNQQLRAERELMKVELNKLGYVSAQQ